MSLDKCPNDVELKQLTQQLAEYLCSDNLSLVTAESCTGGWIAKCCTDLAGSSEWFEGGMVSYSNVAKQSMLSVSEALIRAYGAVSAEVAEAMAAGALRNSDAHIALAVTGIAGPGGGSIDKPVGTVWFGWAAYADGEIKTRSTRECFSGDRDAIRRQTIQRAINGILRF
ncbi:MAG: nicotinamide-nucleotide amidohydrolase family protein [Xanthomonadales bacterium]|nr:nicotinamide-nucleotide amidohydrolase family protein [Xanthomonadales bacterium]